MYNILFIGIGKMGSPMAGYLSKKHDVSIYNRTKSKCDNWIKYYKGKVIDKLSETNQKYDFITFYYLTNLWKLLGDFELFKSLRWRLMGLISSC